NGADLTDAVLSGAQIVGAQLNDVKLDNANLSQANLAMSMLRRASLKNAYLSNTNFNGADLSEACLDNAHANGTKMAYAVLTQASLKGASLVRADLRDANLSSANLDGARLNRAYLVSCCLDKAQMVEVDLSGAYMLHTRLSGANLAGSSLIRTYLSHAVLDHINLQKANLRGANFTGVDICSASDVTDTYFAKNQGIDSHTEESLYEMGAIIVSNQQRESVSETDRIFETQRHLEEIKFDFHYRYLDLEAYWGSLKAALERIEASLLDAQELGLSGNPKLELVEGWLEVMKNNIERFELEIMSSSRESEVFFLQMGEKGIRKWIEEDFLGELELLRERACGLNKHTALAITVWQGLAFLEETSSCLHCKAKSE
ncbi:MAG: pentapeptide repeat-containing protein, partial [Cyanobacteria bacterium J06649_4]